MLLNGLEIVIAAYVVFYLLVSIVIALGERRLRSHPLPETLPYVSVIVCARNEERNIRRCCDHLARLDYPRDRIEIILVDDESEDMTLDIMREYEAHDIMFRILSTVDEPRILHAKQRPLNMGIRESRGEFVLLTDADVAVGPGWVRAHLSAYGGNTGIVGGTTRVDMSSGRLFDRVQCCDLVSKHAVAMGCAGLGFPISLMGNNASFRREAYELVGGITGISRSIVEDMALMNAIVRRTRFRMTWVADRNGVVVTAPETDFGTFITQRLRWVFEMSDLSWTGKVMIGVESLMCTMFVCALAIVWLNPVPLMVSVLAWTAGYVIILWPSPGKEEGDFLSIPATLVFQMVYGVSFAVRRMVRGKRVVWKGRIFEKGA